MLRTWLEFLCFDDLVWLEIEDEISGLLEEVEEDVL